MQVAEKHHTDRDRPRWWSHLIVPILLFLLCIGFFWKIVLTNQYTWLESPDLAYQVLPWYQYQAGEIHAGRVPLWDPYHWGGQSLIGQAQPGVAYPLNWILFSLPLRNGWIRQVNLHWYFVVIHFMAVLFCYWLCRDLKRSRLASIAGGLAFGLGGYIGTTEWPQMLNGAVWAPLVFLFLLRALRGERPVANSALSGMFLGVAWLSGHHQIPIFITLAVAGVWLYFLFKNGRFERKIAGFCVVFGVFLVLTSASQTLPSYEYGRLAKRWVGASEAKGWKEPVPYNVHGTYSLGASSLLSIVVPDHYRHNDPSIGLVALTLALLGVALGWRHRPVRLFGAVAIGGLLFSLGRNNVFHGILYAVVPLVEKARTPAMAVFIFHFGIAVLIAYGIDSYLKGTNTDWQRRAVWVLAGLAVVVLAIGAFLVLTEKMSAEDRWVVDAFLALLFAAVLYGWRRGTISQTSACVLAIGLMLIEWNNYAGFYWPNKDETNRTSYLKNLREFDDIAKVLRTRQWPVRVEVSDQDIPFNFGDWQGIDQWGGYTASLPLNLIRFDQFNPRVKRMFGVNYTLTKDAAKPDQQEVFQSAKGLKVLWNTGAFPRVWAVHEVVEVHDDGEAAGLLLNEGFDLRHKAFVLGPAPKVDAFEGEEDVRLLSRTGGSMLVDANLKCKGMLVFGESWFPGWKATVDGKPVKIYEADRMARGVVVEAGHHKVEMNYRPGSVYAGALMTIAGLAGAPLMLVVSRRRRRK